MILQRPRLMLLERCLRIELESFLNPFHYGIPPDYYANNADYTDPDESFYSLILVVVPGFDFLEHQLSFVSPLLLPKGIIVRS